MKIVIVGGGFGGLNLARSLKRAPVDLLLIDKTNHHLFQPLLYEVATAALSPGQIATPIREILRTQDNARVIMGDVVSIDKQHKQVILGNQERISYDLLVLATGARHSYFGNDQWETFAPGLKTIADALHIRQHILSSFEKAERLADITNDSLDKYLNFVIIGGGPTGVEMAGAIAEIAHTKPFLKTSVVSNQKNRKFISSKRCPTSCKSIQKNSLCKQKKTWKTWVSPSSSTKK